MRQGIFLKFKLAKFFLFEVIFFKSNMICFFKSFGKLLTFLMEISFFDNLEIISIRSNDISLLPFNGRVFFLLTNNFDFLP